jgi:ribokinase
MTAKPISILGIFVADLAFRTKSLPVWGETVLGSEFRLGPGGKGSNQSVAAARLGAKVHFISKVGDDSFADMAQRTYEQEGIDTRLLIRSAGQTTGAAAIIVQQASGENAIIVASGAANALTCEEIDLAREQIQASAIFLTQLELPVPLIEHESEAATLTGCPVVSLEDAERAADKLLARGVRNVILTRGAQGALVKTESFTENVEAFDAGPALDTTGAGDAFNGGLAVALSEGLSVVEATRFGCVVAGISVTRYGTAPSMPKRAEVEDLIGSRSKVVP